MALQDYPHQKIKSAFIEHVRTKTEFPTPADIIAIIESHTQKKTEYYKATPEEYERAEQQRLKPKIVPWLGKLWEECPELHQPIRDHVSNLESKQGKDRAEDYCKYLKNAMGAPLIATRK